MRRTMHEFAFLVAILVVVFTLPVLAVRAFTMWIGTWPGERAPTWWNRGTLGAAVLFVVAAAFLIWDTHRISRIERSGVTVEHLRLPVPRRLRRRS